MLYDIPHKAVKSKYFCTLVCMSENIELFWILFQENKRKFLYLQTCYVCLPWKPPNDAIWSHAGFCKQMAKRDLFSRINNQIAHINTNYMKFIFFCALKLIWTGSKQGWKWLFYTRHMLKHHLKSLVNDEHIL